MKLWISANLLWLVCSKNKLEFKQHNKYPNSRQFCLTLTHTLLQRVDLLCPDNRQKHHYDQVVAPGSQQLDRHLLVNYLVLYKTFRWSQHVCEMSSADWQYFCKVCIMGKMSLADLLKKMTGLVVDNTKNPYAVY